MTKCIFGFVFCEKERVYTYKKGRAQEERGEFDRMKKYKWVFEWGKLGKKTESTKKKRKEVQVHGGAGRCGRVAFLHRVLDAVLCFCFVVKPVVGLQVVKPKCLPKCFARCRG